MILFMIKLTAYVQARRLKQLSWLMFLPLVVVPYLSPYHVSSHILGPGLTENDTTAIFAFLGLSFVAIKSFVIVREAIAGIKFDKLDILTAVSFMPTYAAGPITGVKPFRRQVWEEIPEWRFLILALARLGWGMAYFLVFRKFAAQLDLSWGGSFENLIDMYRDFVVLYFDFAGYTSIAIATAMFFGISLPENFKAPFLATSVQDFWRRWHLTLGAFFVSTYLFKPLVRAYGNTTFSIFAAFTIIGLWHVFSLPYFIWGLAHGSVLALTMIWNKRISPKIPATTKRALLPLSWMFTMTFVAFMSSFAQATNLSEALEFCKSLWVF